MSRIIKVSILAAGLLAVTASPSVACPAPVASHGTIWVTDRQNDRVAVYDVASNALLATISTEGVPDPLVADEPNDVAVARGKAFVTNEASGSISVFDVATRRLLGRLTDAGPKPHHAATSPNGRFVAYGVYGTDQVGLIDAKTQVIRRVTSSSRAGSVFTHSAFFAPDGHTVFVTNEIKSGTTQLVGTVAAIDLRTGVITCELDVGVRPSEVVVLRNGSTGYVSVRNEHVVKEIDVNRCALTGRSVDIGQEVDTLWLAHGDRSMSVGLRGPAPLPAQVAVVNLVSFATADVRFWTIPGGTLTGHQLTTPDGGLTYAAFEGGAAGGLALIDHLTGIVRTLAPIGGRPHGIAFAPPDDE
jgi:DNA-binding beta-propeller fold protein YncE